MSNGSKKKVRTLSELEEAISDEFGWRKRELSYLKTAIEKYDSSARATYLRAAVSLLYAHWEGFVVGCLRAYIRYVSFQKERLDRLAPELWVGVVLGELRAIEDQRSASARARLMRTLHGLMSKAASLNESKLIDAQSNLNASRFLGLVACSGLDQSFFETSSVFLDEALVAKRNAICHGEDVSLDAEAYSSLEKQVIELMEKVRSQALDSAQNKKFLV